MKQINRLIKKARIIFTSIEDLLISNVDIEKPKTRLRIKKDGRYNLKDLASMLPLKKAAIYHYKRLGVLPEPHRVKQEMYWTGEEVKTFIIFLKDKGIL